MQRDPDPAIPCMIYKFNKSEHFYSEFSGRWKEIFAYESLYGINPRK